MLSLLKEDECPCAKADCERHGDCVACRTHHATMEKPIFCMRPETVVSEALRGRVNLRLQAAGAQTGAGKT